MRYVILLATALLLVGCNASPSLTPTPTAPLPTVDEVLARAQDAMSEVQSYRFRGSITGTSGEEGTQETLQTGEWAAPDRFRVRFEGVGEKAGHVNELINVGEQLFARDSDSNEGAWVEQRSRPSAQASSGSPSSYLTIPDDMELDTLEEGMMNGVPALHLTYARKQATSQPIPSATDQMPTPVLYTTHFELFIGKEDYRVLQLIREDEFHGAESLTTADGQERIEEIITTTRSSMEFYDYDQPVTIELPELGGG